VGSEMVDNEPELVEHRPSDLGGVWSPLLWDIRWDRVLLSGLWMILQWLRDMEGSLFEIGMIIGSNMPRHGISLGWLILLREI
jgi:hypothetical protein